MNETVQERVERSPGGRAVLSGVILFISAVLLGVTLPDSPIQGQIHRLVRPMRDMVGLYQGWGVFAPNPRNESWEVEARISYSDGTVGTWSKPDGDAFIGEYRFHRWVKYQEQVWQRRHRALWPELAIWLVRTHDSPSRHPVKIELIRRSQRLNPPGSKLPREPWEETTFYVLPVTPQLLRVATGS